MYPITVIASYSSLSGERPDDELINQLEEAAVHNDFVEYDRLVKSNIDLLNNIEQDFWNEVFNGENAGAIEYWINSSLRRLNLQDIDLILPVNDRLFHLGLARPDLNLENADGVREVLGEQLSESESRREKDLIRNRIRKIEELLTKPQVVPLTFQQAADMLNVGSFATFNFLPEHQLMPHKSQNLIGTFYGRDGTIYLAELQFNQVTNQISPPV